MGRRVKGRGTSLIIFVAIGVFIFGYGKGWGADWKLYDENRFYDTGSITWSSTNTVKVWTKTFYGDEEVLDVVARFGPSFKGLSYCIALVELNCKTKESRDLEEMYYSKEGKPLERFLDRPWDPIIPESAGEALSEAICKQPKK